MLRPYAPRGDWKGFTQAHLLRVIYLIRFLIKYLSEEEEERKKKKKHNFFLSLNV